MCGIIGFATTKKENSVKWLRLGRDKMMHRGPDAKGEFLCDSGKVGFGHRRLSILDLSASGNQPLADQDKKIVIVLNGEIYNYLDLKSELYKDGYTFVTTTDTEVVLNAYKKYGEKCVEKLNGMFSFAIYDKLKQIVFIARDRAGEKPLYYYYEKNHLYFSSELKGLFSNEKISRKISKRGIECYLSMGYVPKDLSIIKGVRKLPQGHCLIFNLQTSIFKIKKYWNLPKIIDHSLQEREILKQLEILIEDSVKKQLRADVPVGVLLSGGLDSSIVTAVAASLVDKVKTFTVTFPQNKEHDETNHALLIAKHFDTEHYQLKADRIEVDLLNKLSAQYDEPIIDSSMVPTYLVTKEIKKYCTVALGGDGGDELFGGYMHYSRLLWTYNLLKGRPGLIRNLISNLSKMLLPIGFRGRNWLQSLSIDYNNSLPIISTFFDFEQRKLLFGGITQNVADNIRKSMIPKEKDLLKRMTMMDFSTYLVEDILVKVDRASMLNSLEVRAPLLDYRLIELAFKIDSPFKATSDNKKIILKEYARTILPKSFNFNRKQGFSIPLTTWLTHGKWRNFFEDVLFDKDCDLNQNVIKNLFKGLDKGMNNAERIFGLLMLELWIKKYKISL